MSVTKNIDSISEVENKAYEESIYSEIAKLRFKDATFKVC